MPAVKNRALEQPSPTESNRNGVKELEVHVRKSNMSELKLLCVKNGVKFFQTDVLDWLSVTAGAPAEEEQEPAELPNPTDTHHTHHKCHTHRETKIESRGRKDAVQAVEDRGVHFNSSVLPFPQTNKSNTLLCFGIKSDWMSKDKIQRKIPSS